ncbi:MAG TPA: sulfatase-like hydrolase/transferase [Terriglobales bacterium]|jgi:arylsulfatase A-like enzyme|nr:sulfatase-like hydrolase/transferase [Terriglobales bacterium]
MFRGTSVRKTLVALGLVLCTVFAAATTKPNLILITLDSTRADRMGFLGGKSGVTPNLDHLAAEGFVFEHAYAQAPGTVVSHATILTGTYPQSTEMSEIGGTLPSSLPYLPDLLKAQGYHTAAFVGSMQLDPRNGLAQGFDRGFQTYDAGFRPAISGDARPAITVRAAGQVVANALAWMTRNAQGPMFVWIHLNDPRVATPSYNAAVTAADAAIGKLLAALKQQKLYANTAIMIAADHGESLGAHGEDGHGIFLYDETIHVPLLLKLPDAQPPTKLVAARVRLVDVAPTLLEIAAIPVPSQMQGQSLLRVAKASGRDQAVYSRSDLPQRGFGWSTLESWRLGKFLYVRAPKPELYDLTADPGATHNLAQSSKGTLDTMAGQLDSFDRRFSGDTGKSSNAQLNSAEMQKLASLGYVGLQKSSGSASAATGIDPKDKTAIANKVADAALALEQGKADRAIATLTPLVASENSLYLAEYTLGSALAFKGQHAEAVKHLHRAIELQPDSAWAHYRMGASLLKTGDFKTATVHLEIAAGRLPEFAPAHQALVEAYEHLGRVEDAKKERAKSGGR